MQDDVAPPREQRLFLIDGYAVIYRAFFALISRPLMTSRGENTSAAWGVTTFLQRLLSTYEPTYLGWVHDSGLSFRHEQYPAYKATREKLSDELQADFDRGVERIEQILQAYHIPILGVEGYEADDVIGTLARKGRASGVNVVIVSGDKDFYQLIEPGVWLLNPGRGGPAAVDEQWVGVPNAHERLGVPPDRVTDYLALVGDSSDNVPGVKGIGEKTAVALIEQFGPLEEIIRRREEIEKKRPREALETHIVEAHLSKQLVTIRRDLEIELDLTALHVQPADTTRLRELFLELEFHGLAKAVGTEGKTSNQPAESSHAASIHPIAAGARYQVVQTADQILEIAKRIRASGRCGFDTETKLESSSVTTIDPLRSILVGLTLGTGDGEAFYFPFRHRVAEGTLADEREQNLPGLETPTLEPIRQLLEDETIVKVAQNAKYDILVLEQEGIGVRNVRFDTMIASYVLDPGRRSHGLDMLALEFLGYEMIPYEAICGKGKTAIGFDAVPIESAARYSCEDVDVTLRLAAVLEEQIEQLAVGPLFRDIEMPLIPVLAQMEATGIAIDVSVFARLKDEWSKERDRVELGIYAAAGETFNINSNAQLRAILFEKLQLPILKKTTTGPSTDASVLERLAEDGHVLPKLILEYRELSKLQSTYIDALPALVNPHTGRLHTSFNQTVAATGRLSSSDPNLQNIPVRTKLGREIRRAFIPRAGWTMLSADYSQIELRLLAHLSGDGAFVEAFQSGGDIHRETAARIFDVDRDVVTTEMRARAKTINFATIYGQGAHALSVQLRVPHAEAKAFIDQYFERFTGVRAYLDASVERARTTGYAETLFGRRRFIPELRDKNFNIRAFGERTAQNTPIQGSAADLIKIAMIRVANRLTRERLSAVMLLQVHDELVFEAPPEELETLSHLVREEMEGAAQLNVPLVVDVRNGTNWLETKQ